MRVELEFNIDESDESAVMEKVSKITKHAKELGFAIEEIELKNKEEREEKSHDSRKRKHKK